MREAKLLHTFSLVMAHKNSKISSIKCRINSLAAQVMADKCKDRQQIWFLSMEYEAQSYTMSEQTNSRSISLQTTQGLEIIQKALKKMITS